VGWSGLLLFPTAYLALAGWLTGTTFATSWYTHGIASSYLEGCNFSHRSGEHPGRCDGPQPVAALGPGSQGDLCAGVQLGGLWPFVALHGAFSLIGFMLRQFEIARLWASARTTRLPSPPDRGVRERVPDLPAGSEQLVLRTELRCGGDLPLPAVPAGLPQLDPEPVPHEWGVAGILGGALLCAIHGATVENTLFEDSDQSNTFKAFEPTQEEETYSMVTANRFWSQIFGFVFPNKRWLHFFMLFVPVMGL